MTEMVTVGGREFAQLDFVVWGQPVAKGNLSRNRYGATYDATRGLRAWTRAVQVQCKVAIAKIDLEPPWNSDEWPVGPLFVRLEFRLQRGLSVKRPWPAVKPDIDKLTRAVLDALTGIAYEDDALVCSLEASKAYTEDGARPCCQITIHDLEWGD